MQARLAIDQGTTGTKAFVVAPGGRIHEVGRHRHRQFYPHPGWVEHDAMELLGAVSRFCELAHAETTIGIANQGETVVAWDARTKQPLYNAIVWQDRRTREAVEKLRADGIEHLTRERAGLPLDPYFSAAKLRWLLDNVTGVREAAALGRLRLGTSDAFFLDSLTGSFATDVSTASRTSLMNLRTLSWDPDLCAAFGVPIECLPEIRSTVDDFGRVSSSNARIGVNIVDQQAALFGHGCRRPGDIKITFGTGAFALGLSDDVSSAMDAQRLGLIPTCAWRIRGESVQYALDGGLLSAASAVDWLERVGLADDIATSADDQRAALRGLMFVPAQAGLGCPFWDPSARAMWIGIELATSRGDLCRAVYEGIALRTAQIVRTFERVSGVSQISVDGGLSRSAYFRQLLADATGRSLLISGIADMTAKGTLDLCSLARPDGDGEAQVEWQRIAPLSPIPESVHSRFADAVDRARDWGG